MTTFREVVRTCAVCGHTANHTVLVSTGAFGPSDLDTRPPPPARLALPLEIQCCPVCGYCAQDVGQASPVAREMVRRTEYQAQLRHTHFPYLANLYLCHSMVREAEGDDAAAGWAALRAAWACDDAGEAYAEAGAMCRRRAVDLFTQARARGQTFAPQAAAEDAILVDLLRRGGRFAEALALAEQRLAADPDDPVRGVLRFQRHLCRRRDDGRHTVQEALTWAGRALG